MNWRTWNVRHAKDVHLVFYFLLIYVKWQLTQRFCTNHLFATNHRKKWRERCLVANTYFYRVSIFVFFSNNNVIFVNCIFVGIILDSYFSEARQRANEIVKSSRPVSSPERSLLAETPLHHGDQDQGSIYTETIDLSSPTNCNFRIAEPPRNIFDDIWKISMHFNTILLAINKDLTIIEQNFCTFFGINLFRLWKNTQLNYRFHAKVILRFLIMGHRNESQFVINYIS